jgi:hypothetical protein
MNAMIRAPVVLFMLGAGLWTFWLVMRMPHSMPRTFGGRLRAALLEGVGCAIGWSGLNVLLEPDVTGEVVWDGILAGLVWMGTAFYSKARYSRIQA